MNNVEFLDGSIEAIPLPDSSIDVVISNCVINLSVDKSSVFAEIFRVLRAGGRIGVTDVVADEGLTADERAARGGYVECIAGALTPTEYRHGLETAGFIEVSIAIAHAVDEGTQRAIIRARKPSTSRSRASRAG
jgi:arsenite methyltransferase